MVEWQPGKIVKCLSMNLTKLTFYFIVSIHWVSCSKLYDNIVAIFRVDNLDVTENYPHTTLMKFQEVTNSSNINPR